MSLAALLLLLDRADPHRSIVEQCWLRMAPRSMLYYPAARVSADDLAMMRRIDELYLAPPFYGSPVLWQCCGVTAGP